jgi:hypothetical protein
MQNLFHLYPNLGRVYEIALAGSFSIDLFYDPETYPDAPKDFKKINAYFKGVQFKVGGDLKVELCQPDPERVAVQLSKWKGEYETAESIATKTYPISVKDMPFSETAMRLLKIAVERLNAGISETERVKRLASVIQQMIGEKQEISAEACAEAVHFTMVLDEHNLSNVIVDAQHKEFKEKVFNLSPEEKRKVLDFLKK